MSTALRVWVAIFRPCILPAVAGMTMLLSATGTVHGADAANANPGVPAIAAEEAKLLRTLEGAVQAREGEGAWSVLRGRAPQYLRPDAALLQALHKNLGLRVGKAEQDKADAAIREAQAIYDPVLAVTLGQRKGRTFNRTIKGQILQRKFKPQTPQTIPETEAVENQSSQDPNADVITEIGFRQMEEQTVPDADIEVSKRQQSAPEISNEYAVSVDQLLPWGTRLSLGIQTIDKKTYYTVGGKDYNYGAPWSSALLLDLVSSLPGTAGFGDTSTQAIQTELRRKDLETAHWQVKAAIEAVTAEVDNAYWLLVARLQQLDLAADNTRLVQEQAQHVQRLIQGGRATNFEGALLDGELARARVAEEEARQLYVSASQTMALLLEDDRAAVESNVYLPYGFSKLLAPASLPSAEAGMATALKERADVHLQTVAGAIGGLQLVAARNAARPDLKFNASLQARQNGSVYGYKSLGESLGAIFDPDSFAQNYGLTYNYPLFNHAARARRDAAAASDQDNALAQRQLQRAIRDEIDDGYLQLRLLAQQIDSAENEVKYLQTAYDRLQKRREIGSDVNENELIETLRNLYAARAALLTRRVARKQVETALFRAMGMQQQLHVSDAADSAFDRMRLTALANSGELRYFTPATTIARPQVQP